MGLANFTQDSAQKATQAGVNRIVRRAILDCLEGEAKPQQASSAGDTTAAKALSRAEVPWPNAANLDPEALFISPAAAAIKEEILRAGKKLWQRAYVDGNGGNISARITDEYVICTPTLCSKADMLAEDLSLVDLNNFQICGDRAKTSEILMHLEIYKAVPHARAVIHCHPPYAT